MSQRMLRNIAIVILVVFAITIVVYPLIFGTDEQGLSEPPVELELNH